jgi:hypothetical protein
LQPRAQGSRKKIGSPKRILCALVIPQFSSASFRPWEAARQGLAFRTAWERLIFPFYSVKTQEDAMRYTEEEMEIMNEFETLRDRESEILDVLDEMELTLAEKNALEYSLEFASEEMGSLRGEYFEVFTKKGH